MVFFWPLTAYPLIFFKESDEVGLFFLFYPKNFFLFPLGGDSRYFYLLFLARVFFCFFLVPWILVDIRLVNSKYLSSGVCPLSTFSALVTMERANVSYSYKNIPIPDRHQYKLVLLRRIESFIKSMRWKAYFFSIQLTIQKKREGRNMGLKLRNTPPYQRDG